MKRFTIAIIGMVLVLALITFRYSALATPVTTPDDTLLLVSVSSDGTQANQGAEHGALARNAPVVAFQSVSDNLVPNDTNGAADIFVHDWATHETERVSLPITEEDNGAIGFPYL